MPEAGGFFSWCAVLIPAAAALAASKWPDRRIGIAGAGFTLAFLCTAAVLTSSASAWLRMDSLAAAPAIVLTLVILAMLVAAPRAQSEVSSGAGLLAVLSGTLMIYMGGNAIVVAAGWLLSAAPLMRHRFSDVRTFARPSVMLAISCGLLVVAAMLLGTASFGEKITDTPAVAWAFGLATAAALIRNGIFPFHSWLVSAFNSDRMLLAAGLISAQSGAFLVARMAPVLPEHAQFGLPWISDLALFSALLMAFLAIGETAPRRLLALIAASQGGFLISGLEIRNVDGITGALVHALVVAIGIVGLALVYRCIQARCGAAVDERFAGLGVRAPRMAVFFLLFALALVGLPGTLGFAAEDLLFHGALEAHPALGVSLPLATALSAIALLRLFSHIFLGRNTLHVPAIPDARPRERAALSALLLLLVISGLLPGFVIGTRREPARAISAALGQDHSASR